MRLDLSLLGWLHTLACLVALVLGAMNLLRRKGTGRHRCVGRWYLIALMMVSLTSLGIYRSGRFFFPHWLAIITMAFTAVACAFAHFHRPRRFWLRGHIISTVATYYLLIGGGVNEFYLRIDVLRNLSNGFPSPMIARTQYALMALTVLVLIWFIVKSPKARA